MIKKIKTFKFFCKSIHGNEKDWYVTRITAKNKDLAWEIAKENNPQCDILFYGQIYL